MTRSAAKKMSRKKVETMLELRTKEVISKNVEINSLVNLCSELRNEIGVWKSKSENLAKQCHTMATLLRKHLGIESPNPSPSKNSNDETRSTNSIRENRKSRENLEDKNIDINKSRQNQSPNPSPNKNSNDEIKSKK